MVEKAENGPETGSLDEGSSSAKATISLDHEISELVQDNLNLGPSTGRDPGLSHRKNHIMAFLKQLAGTKGELYSFSCPLFLMSGTSLLEYVAHWMDFPDIFAGIRFANDPKGK
jgi:hypothetical protein